MVSEETRTDEIFRGYLSDLENKKKRKEKKYIQREVCIAWFSVPATSTGKS